MAQAETAQQQYLTGLDVANKLGLARLTELLADVAALPVHQREGAMAHLAQSDPACFH
jgi:hypothetical protein